MFLGIQTTLIVWTPALASQQPLMVVTTSFCLGFQIPCCWLMSLATGQFVQAHLHSFTPNAAVPRDMALDTLNRSHDTLPRQSHHRWSSDLTPTGFPGVFLISYWASGQHIQSPHHTIISFWLSQRQLHKHKINLWPFSSNLMLHLLFPVSGNGFWEMTLTPFFLMPLYPIHHWILQISFSYPSQVSVSHHLPWRYLSPGMLQNRLWPVFLYIHSGRLLISLYYSQRDCFVNTWNWSCHSMASRSFTGNTWHKALRGQLHSAHFPLQIHLIQFSLLLCALGLWAAFSSLRASNPIILVVYIVLVTYVISTHSPLH